MIIRMTDLAREALNKANQAASATALTAIRPIYRNIGTRPDHLGTVTFVEVDGEDYILTAAHIIDHHEAHTLYIGHKRLQDITLDFRATKAPEGDRSRDIWDFAFARADPIWREEGIVPFDISHLPPLDEAMVMTAVGYPNSANRKVPGQSRQIKPTQRRYTSLRLPTDHPLFESLPIRPETHVAISRDPKHAIENGRRVNTFEPRGMSGGVFFGLPDIHRMEVMILGSEPTIFPAGLIVEKNAEHRALFGPALSVIADQIRAQARRQNLENPAAQPDSADEFEDTTG